MYLNDEAVANTVSATDYDPYEHKVMGITAMEKAIGKAKFAELLGGLVEKPQGKPTLVPGSDKRPAISGSPKSPNLAFGGGVHTTKQGFNDNEEENSNG